MKERLAVLRRINRFAESFDPIGYHDDLDFEIDDEYLLKNQKFVVEYIQNMVAEIEDYCSITEDEESELLAIVNDLKSLGMWERK